MNADALTGTDRAIALDYVPSGSRARVGVLWAFDAMLGQIVAGTSQPMIGQLRLTWWFDATMSLGNEGGVPAHPLLGDLAAWVFPHVAPDEIAQLIEGWEALLDPLPLPDTALTIFGAERGARLFALTARLLGGASDAAAGRGWALADFAARCSDRDTAARAWQRAREAFSAADLAHMPRPLRIIARLARDDAAAGAQVPRNTWRLWRAAW